MMIVFVMMLMNNGDNNGNDDDGDNDDCDSDDIDKNGDDNHGSDDAGGNIILIYSAFYHHTIIMREGVRVCGDAASNYFWCNFFIHNCGFSVSQLLWLWFLANFGAVLVDLLSVILRFPTPPYAPLL